jgi:hypothetical protein
MQKDLAVAKPNLQVRKYTGFHEHAPCCHIFTLLTVIPRASPAPQVANHVSFAIQKSRAAVAGSPSTHGLPPTESLKRRLAT